MTILLHQKITFFAIFLLSFYQIANAQFLYQFCFEDYGNYSFGSDYGANINSAISKLASVASTSYYNNISVGQGVDKVNAFFQCRYDLSSDTCQSCVESTLDMVPLCFRGKTSIQFYQECTLYYSNYSIFATMEELPSYSIWLDMINNGGKFAQLLSKTLKTLISDVLSEFSTSSRFFATKTADSAQGTLYTLAQCNEDLIPSDCNDCLQHAVGNFTLDQPGAQMGQYFMPSCTFSYTLSNETLSSPYNFTEITDVSAPPPVDENEDLTPPMTFPDEELTPPPPSTRFFNNGRTPLGSAGTTRKATAVASLFIILLCVGLLL